MQRFRALSSILMLLAAGLPAAADEPWTKRVDPWVLEEVEVGETEMLVRLVERADLTPAVELRGKGAKGVWVTERLRTVAARSQVSLLRRLRELGVEHRPFWIVNAVWVRAGRAVVEELARRSDVAHVHANPRVDVELPLAYGEAACPAGGIEASLVAAGADVLWNEGYLGQDVVVAGQDTGVDWDHPALVGSYRGWNGVTAVHDYNWHDAIHSGGGVCGADTAEPCDDNDHGTHTMGTMVGDTGADRIGMAPEARWMACRNMDQGNGTPASYTECFEFFLAPTDLAGENSDPSRAPDVISNSWSCPPVEGCTDPTILKEVVESVRAAGILVVASAGNAGFGCSTVSDPIAIYDATLTVGATTVGGLVASFSSRGPVTSDGSGRLKPDISAPGVSICSSVRGGAYSLYSGTSMAAPHVAGMAALLISADPALRGDPDALEAHLLSTATPAFTAQSCGGVDGGASPNNTYGYGLLTGVVPAGAGAIFADGFEAGDTLAWSWAVGLP